MTYHLWRKIVGMVFLQKIDPSNILWLHPLWRLLQWRWWWNGEGWLYWLLYTWALCTGNPRVRLNNCPVQPCKNWSYYHRYLIDGCDLTIDKRQQQKIKCSGWVGRERERGTQHISFNKQQHSNTVNQQHSTTTYQSPMKFVHRHRQNFDGLLFLATNLIICNNRYLSL